MCPERVRVTSSRTRATRRAERAVGREIDEQTGLGEVYLRGLMRAQLRLAVTILATGTVLLGGLPAFFAVFPQVSGMALAGVPAPWVVLGVVVYPVIFVAARIHVRASERIERQFTEIAEDDR